MMTDAQQVSGEPTPENDHTAAPAVQNMHAAASDQRNTILDGFSSQKDAVIQAVEEQKKRFYLQQGNSTATPQSPSPMPTTVSNQAEMLTPDMLIAAQIVDVIRDLVKKEVAQALQELKIADN